MTPTHPTDPMTSAILESISDGVFTVDAAWRITSFNRAAEEITGVDREEALGRPCCEVLRASLCQSACPLRKTMAEGKPLLDIPAWFVDADGERVPVRLSTAILRDAGGKVLGAAETFRDLREPAGADRIREAMRRFGDLSSRSPKMQQIFAMLPKVAASRSTVLITGESGTGKEVLARAIHGAGPRASAPFVALNCAAFPDTLIENELFGHEKGAFTGATTRKAGKFELAEGGTLLLDEITEMPVILQAKLLRAIQEKEVDRLGGTAPVPVDVRLVATTNRDLKEAMEQGQFREDLYFRLNVIPVKLPPLRERPEDIEALARHFMARFSALDGRPVKKLTPDAVARLRSYPFAGNVRELENLIHRAVLLADGDTIGADALWFEEGAMPPAAAAPEPAISHDFRGAPLREVERIVIFDALGQTGGNRTHAAQILGISVRTLRNKLNEYRAGGAEIP